MCPRRFRQPSRRSCGEKLTVLRVKREGGFAGRLGSAPPGHERASVGHPVLWGVMSPRHFRQPSRRILKYPVALVDTRHEARIPPPAQTSYEYIRHTKHRQEAQRNYSPGARLHTSQNPCTPPLRLLTRPTRSYPPRQSKRPTSTYVILNTVKKRNETLPRRKTPHLAQPMHSSVALVDIHLEVRIPPPEQTSHEYIRHT